MLPPAPIRHLGTNDDRSALQRSLGHLTDGVVVQRVDVSEEEVNEARRGRRPDGQG
jgi:hypothetical protein